MGNKIPGWANGCIACWLDYPCTHNGIGPYCPQYPDFLPVKRRKRKTK